MLLASRSRFDLALRTVICKHCGLIYHNPRMTFESFARFYEHDYRRLIDGGTRSVDDLFRSQVKHGYQILAWIGDALPGNARVLDIGSGPGGQLWVIRETRGAHVVGVEPAAEHAEWAHKTHGLDIRAGMLEALAFDDHIFDFVIISQTLNHLLDPLRALQRVHSLLKPGGTLFLQVIDFVYWNRLAPLAMTTTIDHPYMFASATLRAMMEQAGFKIIKWEADAELPSRVREPGQPNLHIRALGLKSEPRIPNYPDYRDILKQIETNQRAYRHKERLAWMDTRVEDAKGFARRIVGERIWRGMAEAYHHHKRDAS